MQTCAEVDKEDKVLEKSHVLLSSTEELDGADLEFAKHAASMHTGVDMKNVNEMREKDGRKPFCASKI